MFRYLFKIIRNAKRARLRAIMRGYRILRNSKNLKRISDLKEVLTTTPLEVGEKNFSDFMMGSGVNYGEIVIRQYLLIRIGGNGLNKALLSSLGNKSQKVIFPLPREWRVILSRSGFNVAAFRSSLLWGGYVVGAWGYGVLTFLITLSRSLTSFRAYHEKNNGQYAYFANLSVRNLPSGRDFLNGYDIFSWYLNWRDKSPGVNAAHHSVSNGTYKKKHFGMCINYQPHVLPPICSFYGLVKYLIGSIFAALYAIAKLACGDWRYAFLLNQIAISMHLRCLVKKNLASEYFFHNSSWIYRPLWTYDAEFLGAKIYFYFYSTNCEKFKVSTKLPSLPYGWAVASWPRYLVWDGWQEKFIKRFNWNSSTIKIVGPIYFEGGQFNQLPLVKDFVAVFDVQPMRKSFYETLGSDIEYYVPAVVNNFLINICACCSNNKITIVIKRKRDIGENLHASYAKALRELKFQDCVIEVAPESSAWELISQAKAVISMPFTSTALIARHLNKPSVYYDPTGELRNDDPAAHGIPVISSLNDLEAWMKKVYV